MTSRYYASIAQQTIKNMMDRPGGVASVQQGGEISPDRVTAGPDMTPANAQRQLFRRAWETNNGPSTPVRRCIWVENKSKFLASGGGELFESPDGSVWTPVNLPPNFVCESVEYSPQLNMILVLGASTAFTLVEDGAGNGLMYHEPLVARSTDDGATWTTCSIPAPYSGYFLSQPSYPVLSSFTAAKWIPDFAPGSAQPGRFFVLATSFFKGRLGYMSADGVSWSVVDMRPTQVHGISGTVDNSQDTIFWDSVDKVLMAVGFYSVSTSRDLGQTWEEVRYPYEQNDWYLMRYCWDYSHEHGLIFVASVNDTPVETLCLFRIENNAFVRVDFEEGNRPLEDAEFYPGTMTYIPECRLWVMTGFGYGYDSDVWETKHLLTSADGLHWTIHRDVLALNDWSASKAVFSSRSQTLGVFNFSLGGARSPPLLTPYYHLRVPGVFHVAGDAIEASVPIEATAITATSLAVGTSAPTEKLHVEGNARVSGSVTATSLVQTSDRRLKSELRQIEGALAKVRQLTGYTFLLNGDPRRRAGLVAQEVEAALPEAVADVKGTDFKGVLYTDLVALLVQALKELDDKLEALRAE